MKWVSAKERLPEKKIGRYYVIKSKILNSVRMMDNIGHPDGWSIGMEYGWEYFNTEWLDETPDQPQPDETLDAAAESAFPYSNAEEWAREQAAFKLGAAHMKAQTWDDEDMKLAFLAGRTPKSFNGGMIEFLHSPDKWLADYKNSKTT